MAEKDMKDILKELWGSLTDEQKEKAKACKTSDELMKLAGEEGIELPDEVLDAVAGGYIFRSFLYEDDNYSRTSSYQKQYVVIDDNTGEVVKGFLMDYEAVKVAKERGLSWAEIDDKQLEALRRGELGTLTAEAKESNC